MDRCHPYTVIDAMSRDATSMISGCPSHERYERIRMLIDKARSHGFEGMADLNEFCRLGLRYGLHFDRRPRVKAELERTRPQRHVHELLASLTPSDFKEGEDESSNNSRSQPQEGAPPSFLS